MLGGHPNVTQLCALAAARRKQENVELGLFFRKYEKV